MEENKRPEFGTRETGMFVPDGFFAEFQKNLEHKIDIEAAKKAQRKISIRRWSIAASICLLLGLAPVAWNIFSKDNAEPQSQTADVYAETDYYEDMNSDEIMVSVISDLDIYETFYANL